MEQQQTGTCDFCGAQRQWGDLQTVPVLGRYYTFTGEAPPSENDILNQNEDARHGHNLLQPWLNSLDQEQEAQVWAYIDATHELRHRPGAVETPEGKD